VIVNKVLYKRAYRIILFLNDAHHSHSSNGLPSRGECPGDHCSLLQLLLTAVYNPHYLLFLGTIMRAQASGRAGCMARLWREESNSGELCFLGLIFILMLWYYTLCCLPKHPPPPKGLQYLREIPFECKALVVMFHPVTL